MYNMFRLSISAIIIQEYWFTQRIKKGGASPYKHWVGTFGFPPEGALGPNHVGILCVMYDFWGTR